MLVIFAQQLANLLEKKVSVGIEFDYYPNTVDKPSGMDEIWIHIEDEESKNFDNFSSAYDHLEERIKQSTLEISQGN